jgi:hypothetical protein
VVVTAVVGALALPAVAALAVQGPPPAPTGQLSVTTVPASTGTVYVDAVDHGLGPVTLTLPAGDRQVCFGSVEGSRTPDCRTVRVRAGATTATTGDYRPERPAPVADPSFQRSCPATDLDRVRFTDVAATHAHGRAITCAAGWGVANGVSTSRFGPDRAVTREQFASMLDRALRATGHRFDPTQRRRFADVGGTHADAVERLAGAGIISGRADGTFGATRPVRRDQMASLLIRSLATTQGLTPAPGPRFVDVTGGAHADNVRRLAGAGITQGVGGGRYGPDTAVTRAQMATFLMRTLDVVVDQADVAAPAPR